MRLSRVLIATVPAVLVLAACSTTVTVAQADLESSLQTQISSDLGVAPEEVTVTCPGDLEGKVGAEMSCQVSGPPGDATAVVTVDAVDGTDVSFSYEFQG